MKKKKHGGVLGKLTRLKEARDKASAKFKRTWARFRRVAKSVFDQEREYLRLDRAVERELAQLQVQRETRRLQRNAPNGSERATPTEE